MSVKPSDLETSPPNRAAGQPRRSPLAYLVRFQSLLGLILVVIGGVVFSPRRHGSILFLQADNIAKTLKAAERGEKIDFRFAEKVKAARKTDSFTAGIVMDDKIIKITLPWTLIRETSESGLAEWILKQMRGHRDTVQ